MVEGITFPKGGTIVFLGEIFGGRFRENYHFLVDASYDQKSKTFLLRFNNMETCQIYNPINIVSDEKSFSVEDASFIKWNWYYYGRPQIPENSTTIEYEKINSLLVIEKSTDIHTGLITVQKELTAKGVKAVHLL